ncbi:MAG: hypothetical protein PHW04_01070 [Candidatus Wallbacteria bacterium]|nr:hypothetical protein [Candidatus Wallbacteria bacterium]
MPKYSTDFQEIGHCGGKFTIYAKTAENGRRQYQIGYSHCRPTAASLFAIYALPEGIPVGTIQSGYIGTPCNPPPCKGCLTIYIASDSLGMFGHQCQKCKKYWRSASTPTKWKMTCPYCGFQAESHEFLAVGQLKFVESCCMLIEQAMLSEQDGEYVIDMDKVADAVGKGGEKPEFYYAEESQQNKFCCSACNESNDILGRYGYCCCCGTHNGLDELEKDIKSIRERITTTVRYEDYVKDAISAFDSYARQIGKQLAGRIPMTSRRRKDWEKRLFHKLGSCVKDLQDNFDIDLFKGFNQSDKDFAILMFHRRHIYEHNGGEVDDKYIQASGDTSVRPKQVIRESKETALKISELVMKMGKNLHDGFHEIFVPEEESLQIKKRNPSRQQ